VYFKCLSIYYAQGLIVFTNFMENENQIIAEDTCVFQMLIDELIDILCSRTYCLYKFHGKRIKENKSIVEYKLKKVAHY
jgi:hypothetical protein